MKLMLGDDVVGTSVGVKLIVGENVGGRLGTSVGVKLMLGDDVGEKVGGDDGPLGADEGIPLINIGRDVGVKVGTDEGFPLINNGRDVGVSVGSSSGSSVPISCKVRCNGSCRILPFRFRSLNVFVSDPENSPFAFFDNTDNKGDSSIPSLNCRISLEYSPSSSPIVIGVCSAP